MADGDKGKKGEKLIFLKNASLFKAFPEKKSVN